jgi:HD superfamily phosphohydrolase
MPDPDDRDKVIRDPVHNLIRLPRADKKLLLALLDRPELQRLRRIRQLGVSSLVYPGAEHSRFAHSLGVFHVARRMTDALSRHYDKNADQLAALGEMRREILVAALLHDVGHAPFSHLLEPSLSQVKGAPKDYPDSHEAWSRRIIKERFAEILDGKDVRSDVVIDLLNKKSREHLLARDFINSQLDADRLDFVLRDRHAAGVHYGSFDLEWILHVIRIGGWKPPGSGAAHWRLCFLESKATPIITEFLLARAHLYRQLYIHKTTRGYEALLRSIVAYAADLAQRNRDLIPPTTPPGIQKLLATEPLTTAEYLELDDFRLWTLFADWAASGPNACLRSMCRRLVFRGRPYQSIPLDQDGLLCAAQMLERLKHPESALRFRCYLDRFTDLAYKDAFGRSAKDDEELQFRSILLLDDAGNLRLAGADEWIKKIGQLEVEACRLYYDDQDEEMTACLRGEHLLS